MKRTLLSCSLLLAVSGAAVAGTPISQTRSVDAHARIDVSNIKGAVTVSGCGCVPSTEACSLRRSHLGKVTGSVQTLS